MNRQEKLKINKEVLKELSKPKPSEQLTDAIGYDKKLLDDLKFN